MTDCTVYIDEAGDLGFQKGTQWFVLSAVIVNKKDEPHIRAKLSQIKGRLNVNEIHLRKMTDFYKRAVAVQEIDEEDFTYMCVVADTNKLDYSKIDSAATAYNYLCRMLLERVSWFLRDTNRIGDIVLSARGTSRDGELISYIKIGCFHIRIIKLWKPSLAQSLAQLLRNHQDHGICCSLQTSAQRRCF